MHTCVYNFDFTVKTFADLSDLFSLPAASGQAFCGNKVTEGDEQCDCGFGECDANTCCVGRDDKKGIDGCVLRPGSVCR